MATRWFILPTTTDSDRPPAPDGTQKPGAVRPKYVGDADAVSGTLHTFERGRYHHPFAGEARYVARVRADAATLDDIAARDDVHTPPPYKMAAFLNDALGDERPDITAWERSFRARSAAGTDTP